MSEQTTLEQYSTIWEARVCLHAEKTVENYFFSSNFLFLVLSGEKKTNPSYPNHAIIQSPPELPFPKPNQRKIWVPNYLFLLIPENQRNEMQNKTSPRKKKGF